MPACDRCVLRWEWIAVQQVSNIEFYSSCTDVQVTNPNGVGRVLTGVVTIGVTTGIEHLPSVWDEISTIVYLRMTQGGTTHAPSSKSRF